MPALENYQKAINEIDDYFEYRNESQKDKDFVRRALAKLTENLASELKTTSEPTTSEGFSVDDIKKVRGETGASLSGATMAMRLAEGDVKQAVQIVLVNNRRKL